MVWISHSELTLDPGLDLYVSTGRCLSEPAASGQDHAPRAAMNTCVTTTVRIMAVA
jgi:hypothetical protein